LDLTRPIEHEKYHSRLLTSFCKQVNNTNQFAKGEKMNVQIDNVMKRARSYWFVDDFTEIIVAGLLFYRPGRNNVIPQICVTGFFPSLVSIHCG